MRRQNVLSYALIPLVLSLGSAPSAAQQAGALERGRQLSSWLRSGATDSLVAHLSDPLLDAVGGVAGLEGLGKQLEAEAGAELEVLEETAFLEAGHITYYRVLRFERVESLTMRWVWNREGTVVGANVSPTPEPAESDRLEYETQARLQLPFGRPEDGLWYVAWGGRDAIHNYHVQAPDQRFAYDFVVMRGGAVSSGDGARNEDHFCWGQRVLAPAGGRVTVAVDTVADNARPGEQNRAAPPGNHVVIDHGNGEYSLIAHLQRGSVRVDAGDELSAGDTLGLCGNSGNSSLPHVHYHLQTGPAFGEGVGLPAMFNGYFVGGELRERGEPVRGEFVRPN